MVWVIRIQWFKYIKILLQEIPYSKYPLLYTLLKVIFIRHSQVFSTLNSVHNQGYLSWTSSFNWTQLKGSFIFNQVWHFIITQKLGLIFELWITFLNKVFLLLVNYFLLEKLGIQENIDNWYRNNCTLSNLR